jgi:hypothetical protein
LSLDASGVLHRPPNTAMNLPKPAVTLVA